MTIDVENLSFAYRRETVLKDAAFHAHSGEIICLLGCNGAGKSTLFRCILRLLTAYTGSIRIDGRETRAMSRRELSRSVAYIPQSSEPVFDFTVFDVVLMGRTAHLGRSEQPGREDEEIAFDTLGRLGIEQLATRGYASISGGERQMALIARALAQRAGIVVMDEPTANLDVGNQFRVMEQVERLKNEGYLIILSTHNPQQALSYADRVLILKDGRILLEGEANACLTEETLRQLYGVGFELFDVTQRGGAPLRLCTPTRR